MSPLPEREQGGPVGGPTAAPDADSSKTLAAPGATGSGTASGVVVLGTGRSGTSAVTRAFVLAGFFAGREEDLYPPQESNPLGHFEPLSVLAVNEELLESFGCSWWADAPGPEEQIPLRAEVTPRLEAVIDGLLSQAGNAPIAVKEPRINGLLPLWEPVIEARLHPVVAVRDPLEIALSQMRRDGTSVPHALAAWEAQMTLVLRWLDGRTATIAPFTALTLRRELAAEVVAAAASHLTPASAALVRPSEAVGAVRPDLRNERGDGLEPTHYLTGRQAVLWEYLAGLRAGDTRIEIPAELHEESSAAREAMARESERAQLVKAHADLLAAHSKLTKELMATHAKLERAIRSGAEAAEAHASQIAGLEASLSWRITGPLRRLKARLRRR